MKVLAVSLVVLAVLISVIPQFTECQLHGYFMTLQNGLQVPMKCHWTARAELALGIPLLGVGTTMFFSRRKETSRLLGIVGAIIGVFVILLPGGLIGVCENPAMLCTTLMKPALILMGVLVTGASLGAIGISLGQEKLPE